MEVKVVDITNMSEAELVRLLAWASENLFDVEVPHFFIDRRAAGVV